MKIKIWEPGEKYEDGDVLLRLVYDRGFVVLAVVNEDGYIIHLGDMAGITEKGLILPEQFAGFGFPKNERGGVKVLGD